MREFETQKLKAAIKQQLKLKKAGYNELAEHLECSVPTVKRILGAEDLTLNRLLEILQFLSLSLSELEMLAGQVKAEPEYFTVAQQEFLVKNKNHFAYLMQIFGGETPEKIAEKYGLSQRSTDRYLIALERAELIHVTGRQRVRPAYKSTPNLKDGPLAKAYFKAFVQTGADFFIKNLGVSAFKDSTKPGAESKFFSLQTSLSTPELYKKLRLDLDHLLSEFSRAADYEKKTRPETELRTCVLMSAAAQVDQDNKDLDTIENVFGEIVDI